MIIGGHSIIYSKDPEADRAFLRDVLRLSNVDVGGGWLIFALPPAEVGVHPADTPRHEITLMCRDLPATINELRAKGIEFRGDPVDDDFGSWIKMLLPGGVELLLYEPTHATPLDV